MVHLQGGAGFLLRQQDREAALFCRFSRKQAGKQASRNGGGDLLGLDGFGNKGEQARETEKRSRCKDMRNRSDGRIKVAAAGVNAWGGAGGGTPIDGFETLEGLDGFEGHDPSIAAYVRSMPAAYRGAFDVREIETHAAIVRRRGNRATHVEMWRELPEGVAAICIVADDRAGLLSRICAALGAHHVDIVAAQVYGRLRSDDAMEAVDLLWVRRRTGGGGPPLGPLDVGRIGRTLDELVAGRSTLEASAGRSFPASDAPSSAAVRFERDQRKGLAVLTVEASNSPGLLLAATSALFGQQVQIVASRVATEATRTTARFALAELDGGPLSHGRRLAVETAVLGQLSQRPT